MSAANTEWIIEWCLQRTTDSPASTPGAASNPTLERPWCSPCSSPERPRTRLLRGVADEATDSGDESVTHQAIELPRLIESPEKKYENSGSVDKRRRCYVAEPPDSGCVRRRRLLWLSSTSRLEHEQARASLQAELDAATRRREATRRCRQERMRRYVQRVLARAAETRQALEQRYRRQWLAKERAMETAAAKRRLVRRRRAPSLKGPGTTLTPPHRWSAEGPGDAGDQRDCETSVDGEHWQDMSTRSTICGQDETVPAETDQPVDRGYAGRVGVQRDESFHAGQSTDSDVVVAREREHTAGSTDRERIPQISAGSVQNVATAGQGLRSAISACQCLSRAGFPLRADISFEEATKNHLQLPECIQHADQLLLSLSVWNTGQTNPASATMKHDGVVKAKDRGSGRVFLAAFLVHKFPEHTLGHHPSEQMCRSAAAVVEHFERFIAVADAPDRALESQATALIQVWRHWKREFVAWKEGDRVQLLESLARESVELERLRCTIKRSAEHHSHAVAAESISQWTLEIAHWQEQLNELTRHLGGADAQRYVQRLVSEWSCAANEPQSSSEEGPEPVSATKTASNDDWDADTLLAHEILVDLPGLRKRLGATPTTDCSHPLDCTLPNRIHRLLRRAYFDRFRERLFHEAYLPLVVEAVRDLREVLLHLLPSPSSLPHVQDSFATPLHEQARKYAAEVQRLRATLERELDTGYVQQRFEALVEMKRSTPSACGGTQSVLQRVAHELLVRLIYLALQVLFLVQMPAKDASLAQAWSPTTHLSGGASDEIRTEPPSEEQVAAALQERIERHPPVAEAVTQAWEELFALIEDRQRDVHVARVERWIPLVERFAPAREYAVLEAKYPGLPRSRAWIAAVLAAGISPVDTPGGARASTGVCFSDSASGSTVGLSENHTSPDAFVMSLHRALVWTVIYSEAEFATDHERTPEVLLLDRARLHSWRAVFSALVRRAVMFLVTRHWISTASLPASLRERVWGSLRELLQIEGAGLGGDTAAHFTRVATARLSSLGLDSAPVEAYLRSVRCACMPESALYHLLSKRLAEVLSAPSVENLSGSQSLFIPWQAEIQHLHEGVRRLAVHLGRTFGPLLVDAWREAEGSHARRAMGGSIARQSGDQTQQ